MEDKVLLEAIQAMINESQAQTRNEITALRTEMNNRFDRIEVIVEGSLKMTDKLEQRVLELEKLA